MARKSVGSNKSSVVTVRLSPKEKFGLDLLARHLHTNLAGAVKASIENMFGQEVLGLLLTPKGEEHMVMAVDHVWSRDEHERFARLAQSFPKLLSDEETYAWRIVQEEPKYWKQVPLESSGGRKSEREYLRKIDLEKLAADWNKLKAQAGIQS